MSRLFLCAMVTGLEMYRPAVINASSQTARYSIQVLAASVCSCIFLKDRAKRRLVHTSCGNRAGVEAADGGGAESDAAPAGAQGAGGPERIKGTLFCATQSCRQPRCSFLVSRGAFLLGCPASIACSGRPCSCENQAAPCTCSEGRLKFRRGAPAAAPESFSYQRVGFRTQQQHQL